MFVNKSTSRILGNVFFKFIQEGTLLVKKIKGVYRFNIKNSDGKETWWIVDAKNGDGALKYRGSGTLFRILNL